jgi:ATP-dependent Lon protease
MKIIHPDGKATPEEIGELLQFAMECRRRVREQILRIDPTFKPNDFAYRNLQSGSVVTVLTPEEQQFPAFASLRPGRGLNGSEKDETSGEEHAQKLKPAEQLDLPPALPPGEVSHNCSVDAPQEPAATNLFANGTGLREWHLVVPENTKGWSYRRLFADYLSGCTGIIIRDPYIRVFHQVRNLVEFLRMVNEITPVGDEVTIHLITGSDQESMEKQVENLGLIQDSFAGTSTPFSWEIDASPNFHARSITTDHGWKITIDRGLDLFQWFDFSPFKAEAAVQEVRMMKGCELNYIKTSP